MSSVMTSIYPSPSSMTTSVITVPSFPSSKAPYANTISSPLQMGPNGRLTTPLAPPPPPPLHMSAHSHGPGPDRQVKYAGADHTLGPTFSDEEDGDDSAFIAAKMASLGLDPNGMPYNRSGYSTYRGREKKSKTPNIPKYDQPYPQQTQQQIQQQALLNLLAQQGNTAHVREAMALLELQQAQQAATDRHYSALSSISSAQAKAQYQGRLAAQRQAEQAEYEKQLHIQRAMQQKQLELLAIQREATKRQFLAQQQEQMRIQQGEREKLREMSRQRETFVQAHVQSELQWNKSMMVDDFKARFEPVVKSVIGNDRSRFEPGLTGSQTAFGGHFGQSFVISPGTSTSPTSPSWRSQASSPTKSVSGSETATTLNTTRLLNPSIVAKTAPGGRFAQARAALAASGTSSFGTLTAALSKRSASEDHSTTQEKISPAEVPRTTPASPTTKSARMPLELGIGHPAPLAAPLPVASGAEEKRVHTYPLTATSRTQIREERIASQSVGKKVLVARQPLGPPGDIKDLGNKNFQARIRKQAGLNLGMLGRRTETPVQVSVVV
ncbi:uncharacterized protein L203_105801 [Cryptococcus depauperatus CBS 7841]|uniref:Uncharacterized protein n=1 Tax=Cryptococcus depauperatus CBS 7841 TaxID=1295531 RepID=A0AAJ8JY13_9TREE